MLATAGIVSPRYTRREAPERKADLIAELSPSIGRGMGCLKFDTVGCLIWQRLPVALLTIPKGCVFVSPVTGHGRTAYGSIRASPALQ